MLGSFSVGKTSLVKRYVHSIFSDEYKTTIGVKIDKRVVQLESQEVNLVIWDIHGDDEFQRIRTSFLRGTAGYFMVVDPTRPATIEVAKELRERMSDTLGDVPCLTLLNKADLEAQWEVSPEELEALEEEGWTLRRTSAKSGMGVEEAFLELANRLVS